jgi:preprotein translocase SecE subunit
VLADTFSFSGPGDPSVFNIARLAPAGDGPGAGSEITQRQGVDAFEQIYLQGGAAIAVILIGAIVLLYLCYANRKTVEFLIATEGEMKKVNWSSRREVLGSTWVVIAISVLIAAILLVADIAFSSFFRAIDLLES